QQAGFVTLGNPGQSWHAAETGDFNGDGKADILFRNDSGAIWEWQMNTSGSLHIGASSSVGNPGSSWSVV
ncbi:MAG: FG-GAP repeat domain-containing protein, partial [Hyphomicrobiales bacterium]